MNIASHAEAFVAAQTCDWIDLKGLRYFTALGDAGSFGRAAIRLGIAESNLRRQITRLETALNQRLFTGRARNLKLTKAGQLLLEDATDITSRVNRLPERMKEVIGGKTESLSIGFAPLETFVPQIGKIIACLTDKEPQLSLRFCVDPRACLIEAILDRRVDACFADAPTSALPGIRIDELFREPVHIVVPSGHRLARRKQIGLAEVAQEPFILCARILAPDVYDEIISACGSAGFVPRVVFQAPAPASAMMLASAGLGITLIPASFRADHPNLHFLDVADWLGGKSLALITRAEEQIAGVTLLRKHALTVSAAHNCRRRRFHSKSATQHRAFRGRRS